MKKRILIIDDDLGYISIVQKQLEQQGFDVSIASTKEKVDEKLSNSIPDLFLIDVQLDNQMGLKILKKIAKEYKHKNIIVITSAKDITIIEKSFNYGACDYVIKPFNIKDLKNKIFYALNNSFTKPAYHV